MEIQTPNESASLMAVIHFVSDNLTFYYFPKSLEVPDYLVIIPDLWNLSYEQPNIDLCTLKT
jgi:hypothetical protein